MKADKQLIQTDDAGHKCDIVINKYSLTHVNKKGTSSKYLN